MNKIRCIAFDCFGTLFDVSSLPNGHVAKYVEHVRREGFEPYNFPDEWDLLEAHAGVAEGICRLMSMGIYCVALSNGSRSLIQHLAWANEFAFTHIVNLVAHRCYKPHLAAYRTIKADLGIEPHETLLVTANPTFGDVYGAFVTGMTPMLLRQPGWPQTVVELAEWLEART